MTEIPRVQYRNGTQEQRGGKVIQVRFQGADYLFVGPAYLDANTRAFHGDHLRMFLADFGITDLRVFGDVRGERFPIPKEDRYELIGAGNCIVSEQEEADTFWGSSCVYDIPIHRPSLVSIVPYFPRGIKVFFRDTEPELLGVGEGRQ